LGDRTLTEKSWSEAQDASQDLWSCRTTLKKIRQRAPRTPPAKRFALNHAALKGQIWPDPLYARAGSMVELL